MSIIRYRQPGSFFHELQQELLPLLSTLQTEPMSQEGMWAPKVDIKEEADKFVVFADIPGIDPDDIEIEMDSNLLTVKGERKAEKEEKGKNYYRMERSYGKFYRQFTLPESIDSNKITAKSKHGVLMLCLPKAVEGKQHRKITIEKENEKP